MNLEELPNQLILEYKIFNTINVNVLTRVSRVPSNWGKTEFE